MTIIATDVLTTALVLEFKLGRHSWDLGVTPANLAKFIILLSARASLTLTSLGWTKTAFAVTLLRLTEGLTRRSVWFIIISLNITTILSGLVPWIQCSPLQKTWNPVVEGTCWAPKVGTKIWIGMGGMSYFCFTFFVSLFCKVQIATNLALYRDFSIFGPDGLHTGRPTMDISVPHCFEEQGKVWHFGCHEHGRYVSVDFSIYTSYLF